MRHGVKRAALMIAAGLLQPSALSAQAQASAVDPRPLMSCIYQPERVPVAELESQARAARTSNRLVGLAFDLEYGRKGAPYDWAAAIRIHRMAMERAARFAPGTLGELNWREAASTISRMHEKGLNGASIDFAAIDSIYREQEARGIDVAESRTRTNRMKAAYDAYWQAIELDITGGGKEAMNRFRQAADAGIIDAMFNVGRLSSNGRYGGPVNSTEAEKWLRRAADEGHDNAMYFLGGLLLKEAGRRGSARDDQMKALSWFYEASLRDHAYAMMALGLGHQNRMGKLSRNRDEAMCWYRRASTFGNDSDGSRQEARKLLDALR